MMVERIGEPAMLEQLAEEATELAKAALKKARVIRKENPTPVTLEEANANLIEETADVIQCIRDLSIPIDEEQMKRKTERFLSRIENNK